MNDLVRTSLVLIAIPLLSIFVPAALTWARDLDSAAKRIRQLDEQNRIVSFWKNWMKVESSIPPNGELHDYEAEARISATRNVVRRELAQAGRTVIGIYRSEEFLAYHRYPFSFKGFQCYRAHLSLYRRALLLYRAPNPPAKVLHATFHILLFEPVIVAVLLLVIKGAGLQDHFGWLYSPHIVDIFLLAHARLLHTHTLAFICFFIFLSLSGLLVVVWITVNTRQRAIRCENDRRYYVRDQILSRYDPHGIQET